MAAPINRFTGVLLPVPNLLVPLTPEEEQNLKSTHELSADQKRVLTRARTTIDALNEQIGNYRNNITSREDEINRIFRDISELLKKKDEMRSNLMKGASGSTITGWVAGIGAAAGGLAAGFVFPPAWIAPIGFTITALTSTTGFSAMTSRVLTNKRKTLDRFKLSQARAIIYKETLPTQVDETIDNKAYEKLLSITSEPFTDYLVDIQETYLQHLRVESQYKRISEIVDRALNELNEYKENLQETMHRSFTSYILPSIFSSEEADTTETDGPPPPAKKARIETATPTAT